MTQPTAEMILTGDRRRRRKENRVRRLFLGAAVFSIVISVAIVGSLLGEAWNFISQVELSSLWEIGWFPRRDLYDIPTIILATLLIAGVAMVVATPLGLGAAIYLSEYASSTVRRIVKPILEVLAGIPTVVVGFFALTFIGPEIVRPLFNTPSPFSMAAAGVGVGLVVVPLVASVSEDAMRAVPNALREASYGLGANKSVTVRKVVFPAAISGIVASLILGVSRAIGETMVVFMAAGAVGGALRTYNPLDTGQTMTAAMASLAIGTDNVAGSGSAFQSLFFVGVLLFLMTLTLNLISDRFVRRVREKY